MFSVHNHCLRSVGVLFFAPCHDLGRLPSKVISASLLAAQHSFMEVQVSHWGLQWSETWEPRTIGGRSVAYIITQLAIYMYKWYISGIFPANWQYISGM